MGSLQEVKRCLDHISNTPSRNEKESLIKRYLDVDYFAKVVFYALNPFMKYNVRSIRAGFSFNKDKKVDDIFSYLDVLNSQNGATEKDKVKLASLSSIDKETIDVVNKIISKDLMCGANIKLFKKYIPEIPFHSPMLCENDYDVNDFYKFAKNISNVCWSVKLDGVRVWAIVDRKNETVKYISRKGIEYYNFYLFDSLLIEKSKICGEYAYNNLVIFDGEVTSTEKDFEKEMQDVRRIKDADPTKFVFNIFDIVHETKVLKERYNDLKNIFFGVNKNVTVVKHYQAESPEHIQNRLEYLTSIGEEGLVLKTWNGKYEFKRSKCWCKCKLFITEEFKVIGWEYGKNSNAHVVGKLIIQVDKNTTSKVGSGLTKRMRKDFMTKTPKLIEVKYQGKTGKGKLRFPKFVCVRDDK